MNPKLNRERKISKGKFEMTLAEFPLFLLSKPTPEMKSLKYLFYTDTITGKNNKKVIRIWKVFPDPEFGFGTASTLSTLYELFQIWKEDNFENQKIKFNTVHSILKRKKLTGSKENYKTLRKDLSTLVGMKIEAKNAFWDNERKGYVDMVFHLFDQLWLFHEKEKQISFPFGYIQASDVLFASILSNSLFITGFTSEFFHNLTPLEQRLALYLSKIFRFQSKHKRDLLEFAHQLPIYAKQKKHIRQNIKRASNGLVNKGFDLIDSIGFEKGLFDQDFIIFDRKKPDTNHLYFKKFGVSPPEKDKKEIDILVEDILTVCMDKKSKGFYKIIAEKVPEQTIYRALSEVKEVHNTGEIKKSKGALFTSLIKKYSQEQGIEL